MTSPAPTLAAVTGAHLVGSVNLPTAEEVFTTVADHLGGHITHVPTARWGSGTTGCSSRRGASTARPASLGWATPRT